MAKLDVNAQFSAPTLIETLSHLAGKQTDEVLKSRFETLALLLTHIESDKMWAAILNEQRLESSQFKVGE